MLFSRVKIQMVKDKDFTYNSKIIRTQQDIVKYINEIEQLDKASEENIFLICLNTKNQIVAYTQLAKGSISSCNLDMKSIFKMILLSNSSKFILVHNHPSGNAQPSNEDYIITNRVLELSKLMDVQFLDHIVIGDNSFISCMS